MSDRKLFVNKNDIIGIIFYSNKKDKPDEYELWRVISTSGKVARIVNVETGKSRLIKLVDLYKKYTALTPDCTLLFILMEPYPDCKKKHQSVLVAGTKYSSVIDKFFCRTDPIIDNGDVDILIGRRNNIGTEKYCNFRYFSKALFSYKVHTYIDDNIDDIIKYAEGFKKYINSEHKSVYELWGFDNIKDFLESRSFMSSYDNMNEVIESPFNVDDVFDFDMFLSTRLGKNLSNIQAVKYGKDIDLTKIKKHHSVIRDKNGDIFVVTFDIGEGSVNTITKDVGIARGIMSKDEISKFEALKK